MKPITSRPDEAPFAIERFLPFRLSVLSNRLTRAAARVYTRRFRLSAPEWRTLAVLGRYGAMNANAVVERTAMDKVRVSRAVARLLSAGQITRHADAADRRRAVLELTPRGDGVYHDIVPLVRAVEDELLQDLSGEERATLEHIFAKIEARARPMLQDEAVPSADDGEPTG
jgi:DNA-binding MarR family transcriptional regulator